MLSHSDKAMRPMGELEIFREYIPSTLLHMSLLKRALISVSTIHLSATGIGAGLQRY
jgi:hypothetical protein